jgi:hypothetical protein
MICSAVAIIPFSMIFSTLDVHSPHLVVSVLTHLRLVKIWPVFKALNVLKRKEVTKVRIVEVAFTYYFCCHIIACQMIALSLYEPDLRETWLKRVPVTHDLSVIQTRALDPTVSNTTIYIHALYFCVGSISQVAIGDITAISVDERVLNGLFILFGTFLYAFLFGNIASIVSEMATDIFGNFHEEYQEVVSAL